MCGHIAYFTIFYLLAKKWALACLRDGMAGGLTIVGGPGGPASWGVSRVVDI